MLFKTTTVLSLLLSLIVANLDQAGAPNKGGCAVIDGNRPPQFIVYESKSMSGINLRLRNNSSCAIVVETDDRYPTRIKRLPEGGATIESVLDPRDGQKLPLHYLIQNLGLMQDERMVGVILYSLMKSRAGSQSSLKFQQATLSSARILQSRLVTFGKVITR